ncbi:hypothetical protein WMF30_18600 [Sorangium sp. So ce134]
MAKLPSWLRLDADSGDHPHPNVVGNRLIAQAIDLQALAADRAMAAALTSMSTSSPTAG